MWNHRSNINFMIHTLKSLLIFIDHSKGRNGGGRARRMSREGGRRGEEVEEGGSRRGRGMRNRGGERRDTSCWLSFQKIMERARRKETGDARKREKEEEEEDDEEEEEKEGPLDGIMGPFLATSWRVLGASWGYLGGALGLFGPSSALGSLLMASSRSVWGPP